MDMKKAVLSGTANTNQQLDLNIASRFLQALDPRGLFTFQTFDDRDKKEEEKDKTLIRVLNGTFAEHCKTLIELNRAGAGIFVTINRTDLRGRKEGNITGIRSLFLDLDGNPLPGEWPLDPRLINETSPGHWHVFWLVGEGFPLDRFEPVQKTIAQRFGGDPAVCDLPRVMRLPGFLHQKHTPFLVRILQDWSLEARYTPEEILKAFPPDTDSQAHGPRTGGTGSTDIPDPILESLHSRNMVIRAERSEKGKYIVTCPWAEAHTTGTAEAAYFLPNFGGYAGPGFRCLHAHCVDRTIKDLRDYLGLSSEKPKSSAESILLCDVIPEPVKWLWPGYLPAGKLVVLDGDPGLGKSTIALDLAARITRGHAMPDGTKSECAPGGVVILSAEDGPADTIRPRFEAAGGDLTRARILTGVKGTDKDGNPYLLPPTIEAVGAIRETVQMIDARLVIIDPLMAHLSGGTNSNRDQDIRAALSPLVKLADETGAAVLVIRHLNKTKSENSPKYRGGGSIGIIGAARIGLMVLEHEGKKVLTNPKNNLAKEAPTLSYDIEGVQVGEIWTSRIAWGKVVDKTAAEILFTQATGDGKKKPKMEQAIALLDELLGSGPASWTKIEAEAGRKGISIATIRRAKEHFSETETPIIAQHIGGKNGYWIWKFEEDGEGGFEDDQRCPLPYSYSGEHLNESVEPVGEFKDAHVEIRESLNTFEKADEHLQNGPLYQDSDYTEVDPNSDDSVFDLDVSLLEDKVDLNDLPVEDIEL